MNKFNFVSFGLRFVAAAAIVLLTYNPSGYSYFHWVQNSLASTGAGFGAEQAFSGVVILIGWAVLLTSTLKALGAFGLILASAFIGTFVWLMTSYGLFEVETSTAITWTALVSLSALLAIGMSWSHIRRRLSGQVDVDEVNDIQD
ncbi:MAG: hypothetical protein GQ583_05300 [Methyloprofundus sp.]|nr:hypothetical protein [Methyloprofundus sp.]